MTFVIRDELFHELEQHTRSQFHQRVMVFLREEMTEACSSQNDDELVEFIHRQHGSAEAHEIESERGIVQWIYLSLLYGSNFFERPEFRAYFQFPGESMEDKLGLLADCLETLGRNEEAQPDDIIRI
ncbi:MAG TPA: hypothetical protein VHG93_23045 [Longimicrobium sp.]|nr:hypothetical protein [Longimicrobium sp.]